MQENMGPVRKKGIEVELKARIELI